MKSYGKWNKYIFIVTVLSSVMAFFMSLGAYLKTRARDGGKDLAAGHVNKLVNV
jgi:heme/copper-type cytochrome/quinol oxidase subunit 3